MMAGEAYDFDTTVAPDNEAPLVAPQQTPEGIFTDAPKSPRTPQPSFMSQAWHSIRDMLPSLTEGDGTPAALRDAPIESPFFSGLAHGARTAIDYGAEKLARGGEALLGKDTAAALPGYQSAEDIRTDREKRQADYEADPGNAADSVPAMLGRATGAGLTLGGATTAAGRLAALGLARAGATLIPGVARGLEYLSGGAEAAPGAGLPTRLATRGASLAAQGGAAGGTIAGVESDTDKPILPQIAEGAASGAVAGPVLGAGLAAAGYPLRAAFGLVPNMVQRGVVALADRFINQHRIDLDPTQLTQNPTYRLIADQAGKLPWSGAGNRIEQARLQWQGAVAREMGETTDAGVTHDVMDRAATRIGQTFDGVAARTTIPGGAPLQSDLIGIAQDMPRFGLTEQQLTPIRAQFRNVLGAFQQGNGQITGAAYQNLTQRGGPLDSVISSTDPTVSAFGMRIRDALDNAFQRGASPQDQDALRQARYQYRVMKTVEPLVAQRGATGDIEPNALLQRVREQSKRFDPSTGGIAYGTGGTLGDLAYGGQIFFGRPADSGTAARQFVIGTLLGGGVKDMVRHPVAAAGTVAGLLANRALQSAVRSPAIGAAMVANTARPPGPWVQRATPYALSGLLGP